MQEETTPIFKRLWYDWTQQQPGIKPTNPLGQCWVPTIVAFYDQQGLLRTSSSPGSSIRSPHPGSPQQVLLKAIEAQCPPAWSLNDLPESYDVLEGFIQKTMFKMYKATTVKCYLHGFTKFISFSRIRHKEYMTAEQCETITDQINL